MKKFRLLPLGMAVVMALSGCGSASSEVADGQMADGNTDAQSQPGIDTVVAVNKEAMDGPEIDAYRALLTDKLDNDGGGFTAALLKIDDDDTYELAVVDDPSIVNFGAELFTFKDGEVISLASDGFPFYGQSGSFDYYEKKNCFYYQCADAGAEYAVDAEYFFHIENAQTIHDFSIAVHNYYDSDNTVYLVNDEEVSKEEYDKIDDEFSKEYGSDYTSFLPGLATTVTTGEDIEEVLTYDYEILYIRNQAEKVPCLKPAIYLYPEEDGTEVSVSLAIDGYFTDTDPEFNLENGWNVVADADGTIHLGNETFDYLFWGSMLEATYTFHDGFCVAGDKTEEFLMTTLPQLGLNELETQEFIDYWLPKMQDNKYNIIRFQSEEYTDHAVMHVTPEPDTVIRVFMTYYGSDNFINISQQELTCPERVGFTVVEWGGSEVA